MIRRSVAVVVAVFAGLALSACAGGSKSRPGGTAPKSSPPSNSYVAIGASETQGLGTDNHLRQAWPQDVFRALPPGYTFVNFGIDGATVADALAQELPLARTLHPAVATVSLNVNDLLRRVAPPRPAALPLELA